MRLHLYTDGSYSGVTKNGGYAGIFTDGKSILFTCSGKATGTTNNRMEMWAVIKSLGLIKQGDYHSVLVYTDSAYIQKGMELWLARWIQNGWRSAKGKSVKNQDLWSKLYQLTALHQVSFIWIKAHHENIFNIAADKLANSARLRI